MKEPDIIKEIQMLLMERKQKAEELASIDRKIAEIAGISDISNYKKKTFSRKEIRQALL